MSFLYPRTVSIRRPNAPTTATAPVAVGRQAGYAGNRTSDETLLFEGVPANIQASKGFRATTGDTLPTGHPGPGRWFVYIPRRALAKGSVRESDIVTDEAGNRFQVADPYWNSMGHRLGVVSLKVH